MFILPLLLPLLLLLPLALPLQPLQLLLLRGRIHKYSWYDEQDVELEVWGEEEEDGTWALMHCITEALSCKLVRPEVLLFDQRVVAAANVDEVHNNDMCNGICLLSFGI